jgi:hypothetical protein
MSKQTERIEEELDVYDTDIGDEDYGFIFGPDGELKSVFLPDHMPFEVPEKIRKILELYDIQDPDQLNDNTLH